VTLPTSTLPGLSLRFDLAQAATPRSLGSLPCHRWFYFPHSYSPSLVEAILDYWRLPRGARILDPFVGAGTTLVVAREHGLEATGLDVSPLAVLASTVKTRDYDADELRAGLDCVVRRVPSAKAPGVGVSPRLERAFSPSELTELLRLRGAIEGQRTKVREFLMLALLSVARILSRAVADGGWFRWVDKPSRPDVVIPAFTHQAEMMIDDVASTRGRTLGPEATVVPGDSRAMARGGPYEGVITSPPYANRHDYTRVFHVELLLMGLSEPDIIELRHGSLRSHVEARGERLEAGAYEPPLALQALLRSWPVSADKRVPRMLAGYFEDLHTTLLNLTAAVSSGGRIALVIGNVRHAGVLVPVDEILTELGEQAGLDHVETWVIRQRGNSAQQMGRFGREPARESVVFLRKH
jgi:hypothetical protein